MDASPAETAPTLRGDATAAAWLALAHARDVARLPRVVSFTALGNLASQAVMRRIGLIRFGEFDHPNLPAHALQRHVLFATPPDWANSELTSWVTNSP